MQHVEVGWVAFVWGLAVAIVGAVAWLFRLEGRVNTAERIAEERQSSVLATIQKLTTDLDRRHEENRSDVAGIRGDLASIRAVLMNVASKRSEGA